MHISIVARCVLAATLAACTTDRAGPAASIVGAPLDAPAASASNAAGARNFISAPIHGDEEVPAVATAGRGVAKFWLNDDGSVSFKLIVANIENVTQSHIHLAPAGTNGPIVVFLFGLVPAGVTEQGVLSEGTFTQANLIPRPAIGFGGTMAELIEAIETGGAYVNVHTVAHPGGEMRGQTRVAGPN
jgi:CHRD domain-containing protein